MQVRNGRGFPNEFEETSFEEWQWGKERVTSPGLLSDRLPWWAKLGRLGLEVGLIIATIWFGLLPVYLLMSYVTVALLLDYLPRLRFFGISRVLDRYNIHAPSVDDVLVAACGCILVFVAQVGGSHVLRSIGAAPADHVIATDSVSIGVYVLYLAIFLVLVPAEEIMFRKKLQQDILEGYSPDLRVGMASIIFGVIHLPVYGLGASAIASVAVICIMGAIFGYCYEVSQNLLVPIFIHLLMNSIAVSIWFFSAAV